MHTKKIGLGILSALSASLLLAVSSSANSPKQVSGEVLVQLTYITGLKEDGSLDEATVAACELKYKSSMNEDVFVKYEISPVQNKATAFVQDTEVPLTPLGIPDTYSFASDKIPKALAEKGYQRLIFTMEDDFDDDVIHIIAAGEKPAEKCFISSEAFKLRQ
ncbi:hypothetical protein PsAD2_00875 [Pseudovibrio axinellae]|uniref:Uncharacterized protein n=1 Tax=Pseudovibrio axinellae TaxID=989403 RepID=A0A166AUR6_9HYPH|nr:hypothetical protein [Pseudovibrio axinellae]KZL21576.1 hypothetical protein PsAD2_00875 [Pseudovibrio axinellae]SER10220.1 hypothetical protein SAMN05421798_106146 [Pseudovibrio axinellae]